MDSYSFIHRILPLLILFFLATPCGVVSQNSSLNDTGMDNNYGQVTPSVVIIIVVLMAALFLVMLFSIYIRRGNEANANGSIGPLGVVGLSRRASGSRGLDPGVIETFPTLIYSVVKGLKNGKGALECAVCLNEFEDDETLRLIPNCYHVFHHDCIDTWLQSHTTCPVCRADLTEPADSVYQLAELHNLELDLEAQNGATVIEPENGYAKVEVQVIGPEPDNGSANMNKL